MPTALPGSIGMPPVHLLSQKTRQVRQRGKQRHFQIALPGQALQDGGKPKRDSVVSRQREEIAGGEQNNVAVTQSLPNAVGANFLLGFFLAIQLRNDPLAFLGGEPVRLPRPVRQVNQCDQAQYDSGNSFKNEKPPPASQTEPR